MERAVVFDMDGVIFDSERVIYEIWKRIGPKYGFNTIDTLFYEVIGVSRVYTKGVFHREYGEDIPYQEFRDEARAEFFSYVDKFGLPIKAGVKDLLKYLKTTDYKIGLASSTGLDIVTMELKDAGLYDYFDVVIGGDLLKRSKPAPDIYLMACERLGVKSQNAYAIEDSYNGIRSAYAAKMKPIMVPDMLKPNDEMKNMAYAIFDDLTEVLDMLKRGLK